MNLLTEQGQAVKTFFVQRNATIVDFISAQRLPNWSDIKQILTWQYWVEPGLPPVTELTLVGFVLVALFVVSLLIWRRTLSRQQKKTPVFERVLQQISSIVFLVVFMTISYGFFRAEQIQFLSSRMTVLLTIVAVVLWLGWAFFLWKKAHRSDRINYLEKERFFRYIPKK